MISPEHELYKASTILGINQVKIDSENDLLSVFATNEKSLLRYIEESKERIKCEQERLFEVLNNNFGVHYSYGFSFEYGLARTYNLLPKRHTDKPLSIKEMDDFRNRLYQYRNPQTGLTDLTPYLQDLYDYDKSFANWITEEASNALSKQSGWALARGALVVSLPFFIRDENEQARKLLSFLDQP